MERIWIIGCGRFGKIALERLSALKSKISFTVVDPNPAGLPEPGAHLEIINDDGVLFLKKNLARQSAPDWIIPALPVHLAAEWCMNNAGPYPVTRCPPPGELENMLPNPVYGPSGDIYASMADFKCPDNCPEPADHCPVTQKKREENLFDRLERMENPEFEMLVLRSRQLAPGVGGYQPENLFDIQKKLTEKPARYLLATACRCHGVITPMVTDGVKP